jgi:hypothetical protein
VSQIPGWLPELLLADLASVAWREYEDAIYSVYDRHFLFGRPNLFGAPVRAKAGMIGGKNSGFWHLISSGALPSTPEIERDCDLDRCARLAWPRAMIEAVDDSSKVNWWKNKREREIRTLIALCDFSYKIVLVDRENGFTLWTAMINKPHQAKTDEAEWTEFQKNDHRPV